MHKTHTCYSTTDSRLVRLNITVTDGRMSDLKKRQVGQADCLLLVYDLGRPHTFGKLRYMHDELMRYRRSRDYGLILAAIVAIKTDNVVLRHSFEGVAEFASEIGSSIFFTLSTESRDSVAEVFRSAIRQVERLVEKKDALE